MFLSFHLFYIGLSLYLIIYVPLLQPYLYRSLPLPYYICPSPSILLLFLLLFFPVLKNPLKLYIYAFFRVFFSAVLKEPNLRFESAHLTSSFGIFDELIKAL